MNVVGLKKLDFRPDLASIEADRMLIDETASYVKTLRRQVNAAEMYIAEGGEFKKLHGHLSKTKARDKTRIGWHRAFTKEENKFGCNRQTAESYIAIYDAFFHMANALAMWKLPQSLRALYALARLKLTTDQLQTFTSDGSIKPNSTEAAIRMVAAKLKPTSSVPKKKAKVQPLPSLPSKSAPKKQRVEAAFELLARLGLTVADLEVEFSR